jgi:hypothetical protein
VGRGKISEKTIFVIVKRRHSRLSRVAREAGLGGGGVQGQAKVWRVLILVRRTPEPSTISAPTAYGRVADETKESFEQGLWSVGLCWYGSMYWRLYFRGNQT